VLRGIADSLLPDGSFLMMDMAASSKLEENIEHPMGPLLYAASTFHCMTVSLAQGGEGLGTVWGEQTATEYLARAGFGGIEAKHPTATSSTCSSWPRKPDRTIPRTPGALVCCRRRAGVLDPSPASNSVLDVHPQRLEGFRANRDNS